VNLSAPKKADSSKKKALLQRFTQTPFFFSNRHPASSHIANSKLPGSRSDWVSAVTDAPAVSSFRSDTVSVVGLKFGELGSTLYRS
jgi:hypothetical protein